MVSLLILFTASCFFLAHYGNMSKDIYPFLAISVLQYGLYFYFLKRIFSAKKLPILVITLCAAICFSIYLYFPPKLSNDVYRYLWDGLIEKEGYNPYLYVPGDWKFHDLQEANMPLFRHVDWRDKFTPYPPFAQFIFRSAHSLYLDWGIVGGKFLFALPVILSAIFIYFVLDKRLYAAFILNPLLLLELVANAHLDGWVLFLMLVGLYLYQKHKYIPSAIVWTLAIATKVYPIIFVPFFMIDLLRKRKFFEVSAGSTLSVVILYILYIPFISDSLFPITHYLTLPNEQEYNASLYRYLYEALGMNNPGVFVLAAKICGILFLGVTALVLYIKKYSYEALLFIGIAYLLFSPVAFPWYILFLFAFILLRAHETNQGKIIFVFAFVEFLVTVIYFEPGKLILRETMLNIEYFLILLSVLFYKGMLKGHFSRTRHSMQKRIVTSSAKNK